MLTYPHPCFFQFAYSPFVSPARLNSDSGRCEFCSQKFFTISSSSGGSGKALFPSFKGEVKHRDFSSVSVPSTLEYFRFSLKDCFPVHRIKLPISLTSTSLLVTFPNYPFPSTSSSFLMRSFTWKFKCLRYS